MRWFEFRPTFDVTLEQTADSVISRLNQLKQKRPDLPYFKMNDEYGELHLPPEEHRLWSPFLAFYIHKTERAVFLRGRFSPRLSVWTCVWAIYLAMSFTSFFACMLAISQWTLGRYVWGGWLCLGALLAIIILHVISIIGQQWSSDQMQMLRNRLDEIMRLAAVEYKP